METIVKPLTYEYSSLTKWNTEHEHAILTAGERMPVLVAPPAEFNGTDMVWSPEHLLASSVATCYLTTFLYFAGLFKLKVNDIQVNVSMNLEKLNGSFIATKYALY